MSLRLYGALMVAAILACCSSIASGRSMTRVPLQRWTQIDRFPRHRFVTAGGLPAAYTMMHNPLVRSTATLERGESIYRLHCQSCHGIAATGHSSKAQTLSPSPFDLVWLSQMKVSRIDGFLYWSIAEGGAPFKSAMPAYDHTLPADDIWAVITYIQVGLPSR